MAVKRNASTQDLGIDPYGGDYGYTDPQVPMPDGGYPPIGETSNGATPNPPTGGVTGNAGSTVNPNIRPTRTSYDPLPGWDVAKLNQGTGGTNKYQFGRWLQNSSYYNGGSGANSRGNMGALVDAYNQATGGKAKAVGEDAIDFGDGLGTQDVINGDTNQWQWVTTGGGDTRPSGGNASTQLSGLFSQLGNAANLLSGRATGATGNASPSTQPMGLQRNSSLATSLEAARMPYEIARRTQMNNARADLANRGLLSEPGHMQGPEATAINQIETGLAPAYTGAINDRLQQMDALALGELEQNRLWQQFMLDNNLNADRVRADILNGNTDRYLQLLQLWLNAANVAADGFI